MNAEKTVQSKDTNRLLRKPVCHVSSTLGIFSIVRWAFPGSVTLQSEDCPHLQMRDKQVHAEHRAFSEEIPRNRLVSLDRAVLFFIFIYYCFLVRG